MLKLHPEELRRLGRRVDEDYESAKNDHRSRMERFLEYYKMWRNRVEIPAAGEEERSNFRVPLMQWQTLAKWAQVCQAVFGDDAEVVAVPIGPEDERIAPKVGLWASWRLFSSMKAQTKIAIWLLRAIIYGRAHVYRPWIKKYNETPDGPKCLYEGPGFEPLSPDDIIVPAEPGVMSIQDFSWCIRKWWASPEELIQGEQAEDADSNKYFGVIERYADIMYLAQGGYTRNDEQEEINWEEDAAQGVKGQMAMSRGSQVRVFEWYGKWRLPKKLKANVEQSDWKARDMIPVDVQVTYLPDLNLVIGVKRLVDIYGYMENKRPFCEAAICPDGSYWPMGFGEFLRESEREMTALHRMGTEAIEFTVGPAIFYKPGGGYDPKQHRYAPFSAIPTADPTSVKLFKMDADLTGLAMLTQRNEEIAEKTTGVSAQTMGQSISRPNAPRTATGQMALIQQGNIRVFLDVMFFREDMGRLCQDLWEMDSEFIDGTQFFRVTEEDANGVLAKDRRSGGMRMTQEEFGGKFDFKLEFATDIWSKQQKKAEELQLYQLGVQNPLVVQNPVALWSITSKLYKAFGNSNFEDLVPKPPQPDLPINPKREWTMLLEGEEVHVNAQDNDDEHLVRHHMDLQDENARGENKDEKAVEGLVTHIIEHEKQKRAKMMMAAMAQVVAGQLAQAHQDGHQQLQRALAGQMAQGGGAPQMIQPQFQNPQALEGQLANGSVNGRQPPQ